MSRTEVFHDRDMERMSPDELKAYQLEGLRFTVEAALKTPFYQKR